MSLKPLIAIMAIAALALIGAAPHAAAQIATVPIAQSDEPSFVPARPARHRIEINPRPPIYRRCVDWYELQYQPSGTVLYPQKRCWWVRG